MKLKPRTLAFSTILSFCLIIVLIGGASEPLSLGGAAFWSSFGVFAFCCTHLAKNKDYYNQFLDDDGIQ